ncbi:hypothetical protein Tco_0692251 [Tanacetum coccineum]
MADNRTMAQMLQAPIEGYEDAIVVPPINANNFELKHPLDIPKFRTLRKAFSFFPFSTRTVKPEMVRQEPHRSIPHMDSFDNVLFMASSRNYTSPTDTFYNSLNSKTIKIPLDSAAGGNFLDKDDSRRLAIN